MCNISTILPDYASIVHWQQNNNHQIRFIAPIRSSNWSILITSRKPDHTSKAFHDRAELNSHADTTVAGRNCTILYHTERSFDVAKFSNMYEPIKYADIVLESTGFKSVTGRKYKIVFCEALYMPKLDHTLINPNQLRQFHIEVQDNP